MNEFFKKGLIGMGLILLYVPLSLAVLVGSLYGLVKFLIWIML